MHLHEHHIHLVQDVMKQELKRSLSQLREQSGLNADLPRSGLEPGEVSGKFEGTYQLTWDVDIQT